MSRQSRHGLHVLGITGLLAWLVIGQAACVPGQLGWLLHPLRFRPLHLRHVTPTPSPVDHRNFDLLRIHTADGDVTVVYAWRFDQLGRTLYGQGVRFDRKRRQQADGAMAIGYSEILRIEGVHRPDASELPLMSPIWRNLASKAASSMALASAVVLCREMSPTACAVPIERGSDILEPVWDTYRRPGERQH